MRLSLSDIDNDGTLDHTMQEDFFTTCFNLGAAYSKGHGVITGTATVTRPNVLEAVTQLICIADNGTPTSLGTAPNEYVLASRDRNLVLPAFGNSPAIVMHRIAE